MTQTHKHTCERASLICVCRYRAVCAGRSSGLLRGDSIKFRGNLTQPNKGGKMDCLAHSNWRSCRANLFVSTSRWFGTDSSLAQEAERRREGEEEKEKVRLETSWPESDPKMAACLPYFELDTTLVDTYTHTHTPVARCGVSLSVTSHRRAASYSIFHNFELARASA